jgi:DNA-binding transcriptional MerR regulator
MLSGQLAKLAGVSADTLRHYERLGILLCPRRTDGGYRLYPPEALTRVQLIRRALSLGFSLPELVKILSVRDRGGAPCRQVRALAETKLEQLDERLEELNRLRSHLAAWIVAWDERLSQTSSGERAGLLEMLPAPSPQPRKGSTKL